MKLDFLTNHDEYSNYLNEDRSENEAIDHLASNEFISLRQGQEYIQIETYQYIDRDKDETDLCQFLVRFVIKDEYKNKDGYENFSCYDQREMNWSEFKKQYDAVSFERFEAHEQDDLKKSIINHLFNDTYVSYKSIDLEE